MKKTQEEINALCDAEVARVFEFVSSGASTDIVTATRCVKHLYAMCSEQEPEVVLSTGPTHAQEIAYTFTGNKSNKTSYYGNISDFSWVFFYQKGIEWFPEEVQDLEEDLRVNIKTMYDLLNSGVYDMIQLDTHAIIIPLPKKYTVNDDGALHNVRGSAIEWEDGAKQYAINGVFFTEDEHRRITDGEMTLAEVLREFTDVDKRTQAMRFVKDTSNAIQEMGGSVIDTYTKVAFDGSEVKYQLIKFPQGPVFSTDAYYMHFNCPSTGKEHMEGVEKARTVPEAMAWREETTEELWKLKVPLLHET